MIIEILLFIFVVLCFSHYRIRYCRVGELVKNIPRIPTWPIVGSLPYLMVPREQIWSLFRDLNKRFYPIYTFWTTHEVVVNLLHPDDVEILLSSTKHIDKSTAYKLLYPWLKTGLLTSTGEKWQLRRKILTPAFHFNVLKKYMDIVVDNSEKSIEKMEHDEPVQDLLQFSTNYTLNVICEAAMGASLDGMKEQQTHYRDAIHTMGDMLLYRIARPWFRNEKIFGLTKKGHEQKEALNILHGFSKKIINERKEYHKKTNGIYLNELQSDEASDKQKDIHFGIRKKRMAMLDLLIASSTKEKLINDDGIQEEVDTFIFEGHDTAAMGLCFVLLLLAEHTEIQERARAEINEIFEKSNGTMGYSEIQHLNYLELCIKESLRLYPSVPFISRRLTKDLQLKNHLLPDGAIVHVHIYDMHRDPNFWDNPEKFEPERFLSDRIRGRHPFSYIPFSAGPRNCIGQRFVMMELKVAVAHLLRNFILEPIDLAHKIPILSDLVLRPAHPIKIKFTPIKNNIK